MQAMSEEKTRLLNSINEYIKAKEYRKAFCDLSSMSSPSDDYLLQSRYAALFHAIPSESLDLKKLRVAILSTSTTHHFCNILSYWAAREGFSLELYKAAYDTLYQEVFDQESGLYRYDPEVVIIFTGYRDISLEVPFGASDDLSRMAVKNAVESSAALWKVIRSRLKAHIIQNNADLPEYRIFDNYEGNVLWSMTNMLRSFNLQLASAATTGVTIFDLDYLSSLYGKGKWHDRRYWHHSKHAFSLEAIGIVAYEYAKVMRAIKGSPKKCIITDLDGTLWGGVIGDDGIDGITLGQGPDGEAFVDFQKYLLALKKRGIILAVCSKNDEQIAREVFLKHPSAQLRPDDFVVFKANWQDKVANILEIVSAITIGLDSVVFLDDNPAERLLVKNFLPMIDVPDLPSDPSDFIPFLSNCHYFETVGFSEEDKARTHYYAADVKRAASQKQHTNLSDYLKHLAMEMIAKDVGEIDIPRVSQLINKSNQFHLTTTRYSESEIIAIASDKNKIIRCYRLKDCFGDSGIISAVILENRGADLLIDTWVMSCRVISRGVEEFIAKEMVDIAKKLQCVKLIGKYIPTKKNGLVERLYERLHFTMGRKKENATVWELDLRKEVPEYINFIKNTE